jgi:SSS family solute:Na+ symporter
MSSFNSGINSASTIFTVDLWVRYVDREASPRKQVKVGRISTAIIIVVACLWAPVISRFEGVFAYIQEIWGFISPSIVAVFVVGLIVKRAPPVAARGALLLGVLLYALCRIPKWIWDAGFATPDEIVPPEGLFGLVYAFNSLAFLHHMGIVFLVLVGFMLVVTRLRPLAEPRTLPVSGIDVTPLPSRFVWAGAIVVATAGLYVAFW